MAYIPNELYVGFRSDGEDTLTCFMTPYAKDSAFTKRKKTIDDWASKEMNTLIVDNKPQNGFRLVDTSRRYRTNNVLFRVIHPEFGAEFEITAENFMEILQNSDVVKGEIQEKLLIIRDGAKNVLVIENSPQHLGSSNVDENGKEIFLSKKDYKEGDRISVKGIGDVIYLGKNKIHYNGLDYQHSYSGYQHTGIKFLLKNSCLHEYIYFIESENNVRTSSTPPKVLKFHESTNKTIEDVIGATIGWGNDVIYEVGELKDASEYEHKLVPMTNTYGIKFINAGAGQHEAVYYYNGQYSTYGTVILRDDGVIVNVNVNTRTGNYQSATGITFYDFVKVRK